jgi:hypothetical protein
MGILLILNAGILLPIYATGNTNEKYSLCFNGDNALTNIQSLSMANVIS